VAKQRFVRRGGGGGGASCAASRAREKEGRIESWFVQGLYGQLLAMAMPFYKGRRAAHGTAHQMSRPVVTSPLQQASWSCFACRRRCLDQCSRTRSGCNRIFSLCFYQCAIGCENATMQSSHTSPSLTPKTNSTATAVQWLACSSSHPLKKKEGDNIGTCRPVG
jgi:hypothetical protein